ncbi:hypothetical protein T4E_442 [Trichinella pseudospiralis]|uniref:Uncharacterized protein n=1 Tax=Trichinella pseudospiralis TaxID=6337 RepID=A0A0V0WHD3_TRIPS|nr:hypothetical protein T4E_442 [Trichinella pseudospiralis]
MLTHSPLPSEKKQSTVCVPHSGIRYRIHDIVLCPQLCPLIA